MALVFVGLGSNIGDGRANLREAWQRLGKSPGVTALSLSNPYRSAPVGMESDQWFTNAVAVCETKLPPDELLSLFLQIERTMGRDRSRGQDRVIDLDILYYNDRVINEPELVVPHPELANRLFVLAPMAELAPDHRHPVNQATTHEMRLRVAGQAVERISWGD